MKKIHVDEIIQTVEKLGIEANYDLGEDIMAGFKKACIEEESPLRRKVLSSLIENAKLLMTSRFPSARTLA